MTTNAAAWRNLAFATFSMALAFAAWGLISAFAPSFGSELNLSAQSTAFLVAVPVLLGSLARLPMGILTDRFGGRIVFTALFLYQAPMAEWKGWDPSWVAAAFSAFAISRALTSIAIVAMPTGIMAAAFSDAFQGMRRSRRAETGSGGISR